MASHCRKTRRVEGHVSLHPLVGSMLAGWQALGDQINGSADLVSLQARRSGPARGEGLRLRGASMRRVRGGVLELAPLLVEKGNPIWWLPAIPLKTLAV